MSQESAHELRNAIDELNDHRLDPLVKAIDNPDSDNTNIKIISPKLNPTNEDQIIAKDTIINASLNNMYSQSNNHTPLLSADNCHNDDNESITEIDTMNIENKFIYNNNKNENNDDSKFENNNNNKNYDDDDDDGEQHNDNNNEENIDVISDPSQPIVTYTPFEILNMRRDQFFNINIKQYDGQKYIHVDKSWLSNFLEGNFDPNDLNIENEIGKVKTLHNDQTLNKHNRNFINVDQFQMIVKWYGLEFNNQIIERELVYLPKEKKFILDIYPLTIIPHIFCNNASQVNRFNCNQNKNQNFQISSRRSLNTFFDMMLSYFDINSTYLSSIRIWQVEFESNNIPPVIIPSTLKLIRKKKPIYKKKLKNTTLHRRHISSGHFMIEMKQPDGIYYLDVESHVLPGNGLVGLNNLGNSCYMNSALQCLVHIPELNSYFLYHFFEKEVNKDNPLGNKGKVAIAFGSLISSLFDNRYCGNQSSFSPKEFKYTIGHFNSLFADYRQQDSQEFIAYLLDGLHEDLNRVIKKPYVEKPELESGKENDLQAIRELAKKCWDAHKLRNNSIIVDLFVSLYKSTLVCPHCNNVSITFDPYNDLTLPLPITKKWTHKINILASEGRPIILEAQLNRNATYNDLKTYISKYMKIPEKNLMGFEIFRSTVYKNYEDPNSDAKYLPISELISSTEEVWFYEVDDYKNNLVIPVFSTVVSSNNRNNFGLPFFIVLSKDDIYSYGSIEKKMIQKYKQLSTSNLFQKVDDFEYGKYKSKDFKGIDLFFKYNGISIGKHNRSKSHKAKDDDNDKNDNDNECIELDSDSDSILSMNTYSDTESVISYASPHFSIESIFITKLVNSSMDKTFYNRHHNISHYGNSHQDNIKPESSSVWFPQNEQKILRHDLPLLFNSLSLVQKLYYSYNPNNYRLLYEHMESLKQSNTETNQDKKLTDDNDEIQQIDQIMIDDEKDNVVVENEFENNKNGDGSIINKQIQKLSNSLDSNNSSATSLNDGSEYEDYVTASEGRAQNEMGLSKHDVGSSSTPSSDSSDKNCRESSTSSDDGPSLISNNVYNSSECISEEKVPLIVSGMAIVNEFNENFFDLCFCTNNDDNEDGGIETWSKPEVLVNKELEREKIESLEKAKRPVTVYDCLELFSNPETLGQDDLWYCPKCKDHIQATKKIELWSAPDILTIHLKRFESTQSFSDKIDITVDFPIEGLDLNRFVTDKEGEHIYDLFAVDNHYGGLGGGHYTAYVKNFVDGNWYYFNDSRVTPVNDPRESIKGSAYLLFYRKRSDKPLGGEFFQNMMIEIQKRNEDLRKTLQECQIEQVSNTSISETSDEEMHSSEISESPRSNQSEGENNDITMTRKVDNIEGIYSDTNETDFDDGNKRRKLRNASLSTGDDELSTINSRTTNVEDSCMNSESEEI